MNNNYPDQFKHLKPIYNNRRKSPEKAILLLTIIRLHELGQLEDNEIRFYSELKKSFFSVWKELLDSESLFAPDLYIPFWYMEEESFWHVVPKEGKEDVIELMKDRTIKPSENAIKDCVEYVELDEELHFLMTMSSGRLQLRKSLLSTYTNYSSEEVEKLCQDKQAQESELPTIEDMYRSMQATNVEKKEILGTDRGAIIGRFFQLDEDVQIEMYIQYYTFLKNNKYVRQDFQNVIPDVFTLFDKITCHKIIPGELSSSLNYAYSEFLSELKISLMGELDADDFIDAIDHAIAVLEGEEEYEPIKDKENTPIVARPAEETVQYSGSRLSVGFPDFRIENKAGRGYIYDAFGEEEYSVSGALKEFYGVIYRFNYKYACLTVKRIDKTERGWMKSKKIFVASNLSDLFLALSPSNFINEIDDFIYSEVECDVKIKINGVWYDYAGDRMESEENEDVFNSEQKDVQPILSDTTTAELDIYEPKGKLSKIPEVARTSFDFLWMMAIVDLQEKTNRQAQLTLDEIACMMIANAWVLMADSDVVLSKEVELKECVEFLIEESQEYMDVELTWNSSKDEIYEAIKDYPMAGAFEDTVEELIKKAPHDILRVWYEDVDDEWDLEINSQNLTEPCLYSFYNKKRDPYIVMNKKWQNTLYYEHDYLIYYYSKQYMLFLEDC